MFGMTADQTFNLLEDLGGCITVIIILWLFVKYFD